MKNFLSFDVEEWFHGRAYSHFSDGIHKELESRIVGNMEKLLAVLGGAKATFFVLGIIAQNHPTLVKRLHDGGHEIACHGYTHRPIWDHTPQSFLNDILRAKETIERIIGTEILGYRAPSFSITKNTLWALELLREVGFLYDSSVFPTHHDQYGIPDFPRFPHKIYDDFWELPLPTARLFGFNIPFGGGGYFRVYPYSVSQFFIKRLNRRGLPFVFYQHPWELDKARMANPKSFMFWIRRKVVMGDTEEKLRMLLEEYEFIPIRQWLKGL